MLVWEVEIKFLGGLVAAQGIALAKEKVDAVASFRTPKIIADFRSFFKILNYY